MLMKLLREKILERVIKRYRDYVEVINKHKKGLSPSKIAKQLDLNQSTVERWIKNEGKPYPITSQIANLLVKGGIITEEDKKLFEKYNLIHVQSV